MGKKQSTTPRSRVRAVLRMLFTKSRERAAAIKRDNYTCQHCGKKQSKAKGRQVKVQVHHKDGIDNWDILIDAVYQYLLCSPDQLETICPECHKKHDHGQRADGTIDWKNVKINADDRT